MKRAVIVGGALATVLVLLAVVGYRALNKNVPPAAASNSPAIPPSSTENHPVEAPGFLYGRITTVNGATHEGRLRFGDGEEAFWGDYFNGSKHKNSWLAQVPPEQRPKEHHPIEIFGLQFLDRVVPSDVVRQLMVRFGEIARIEARGREVRVTLKSGAVFDLDWFEASDYDDGVRVWDGTLGGVDIDSLQIRTIELLPTPLLDSAPSRLHGTVRTRQGDFTGFVQWNREKCVGTDELYGRTPEGYLSLRFDTIRSIARHSPGSCLVTQLHGREVVLSDTREVNENNRGIYVDDPRYGRVLISWDAFERLDFTPGGSGPAYGDFPPGHALTGSVTTRDGRRLAGRLVYDLDESETVETLDAPSQGVDYTILFGRIASIVPRGREERDAEHAKVILHDGEELQLERDGDLGERNAGMLIFVEGGKHPEYVSWADVERVDLDRPPAMYPPLGGR